MTIRERVRHWWNAFRNRDPTESYAYYGGGYSARPDRPRLTRGNEASIINSVYNRIALDASAIAIQHVELDENGRFNNAKEDSGLFRCLSLEANLDQTGRAFIQDVVLSILDEGCVAIVPVDRDDDEEHPGEFDVLTLRTGKIVQWYPKHVRVSVYNEETGIREEITLSKREVAIVENPFYSVMNEPNSTSQRLIRKLNILDVIDEQSGSGKLDLIIQLPYVVKSEQQKQRADERRKDVETQLASSKYGIAYIDGTEHVTQLNRSVENNLMSQIEYLTSMLYSQLGITQAILDNTADEQTMLNYYNRAIEPILAAIVDELKRKFLSDRVRKEGESIKFFRDPFGIVPVSQIAEIADKFTRNEIATSNEIRQVIGWKPSDDPRADELRNKNLSEPSGGETPIHKDQNGETENDE